MESIILFLILILSPIFYHRAVKGQEWETIREELIGKWQGNKKEIIGGLALFGGLLIGFLLLSIIINVAGFNDLERVGEVIGEELAQNSIIFIVLVFFLVFAEEFFFRAFLLKRTGIWISTIIFTLAHLGYESWAQLFGVFFLGLLLAYWYKRNNSLFQNFVGHLLYNMVAITLYLLV